MGLAGHCTSTDRPHPVSDGDVQVVDVVVVDDSKCSVQSQIGEVRCRDTRQKDTKRFVFLLFFFGENTNIKKAPKKKNPATTTKKNLDAVLRVRAYRQIYEACADGRTTYSTVICFLSNIFVSHESHNKFLSNSYLIVRQIPKHTIAYYGIVKS